MKQTTKSKKKISSPKKESERSSTLAEDRKNLGKPSLEYRVKMYFSYDKTRGIQNYVVELSTFRLFSNMNYSVSTKVKKKKEEIEIKITGLSTNNAFYSNSYAAVSYLKFEELYGKYNLKIVKQDGSVNSVPAEFNIFKKQIELGEVFYGEGEKTREFCEFSVDQSLFTFE